MCQRDEVQPAARSATLGDVLYQGRTIGGPAESDWIALVQAIAAGDQLALHALYERTYRLVFTLTARITCNRATAEELTVDVFYEIWRRASSYDAANGTVLGWVMNVARSRAIDRLRFDTRKKRVDAGVDEALARVEPAEDVADQLVRQEQAQAVVAALRLLTPGEQQAIEAAFLLELSHVEVAARLDQPLGTIKTRIRSGLHKLRQALLSPEMKR